MADHPADKPFDVFWFENDTKKNRFIFTTEEIEELISEAREEGFGAAFDHLDKLSMPYDRARVLFFEEITLQELFDFAGVVLPIWKSIKKLSLKTSV